MTTRKDPSKEPEITASRSAPLQESMGVGVLVVDDQATFRRVGLEVVGATHGFEPLGEATSGEEALALAVDLRPELILRDVRMPVMDGIETARRLSTEHPGAVIVLVSIDDLSELHDRAGSCGAKALIRKQDFGSLALRGLWDAHGDPDSRPFSTRPALARRAGVASSQRFFRPTNLCGCQGIGSRAAVGGPLGLWGSVLIIRFGRGQDAANGLGWNSRRTA